MTPTPKETPPRARAACIALALAGATLLGGCGWSTRVFVKDQAPLAAGRATWQLGEAAGIEVGLARARGTGTQQLESAATVELGSQRIDRPALLSHRATHAHAHPAHRPRIPPGRRPGLE